MTQPDRDYDDILSRVLRSTLDPIDPAGDGLTKIQRRIAEPWLKRQVSLIRMELSALGWLLAVRSEPFRTGVRSRFAGFGTRSSRRRAAPAGARPAWATSGRHYDTVRRSARAGDTGLRRWLGPTMAWLRPALAVAGAVVIVVAGVFALGQVRTDLIGAANQGTSNAASGPPGAPGGPAAKHHSQLTGPSSGTGGHRGRGHSVGSKPGHKQPVKTAPSCSPTLAPSPTPIAGSPTPSPSPSPTASPTTSPTSTPTTSPTTSPPVFGPNDGGGGTVSASPNTPQAEAGDVAAGSGPACATVDGQAKRFT